MRPLKARLHSASTHPRASAGACIWTIVSSETAAAAHEESPVFSAAERENWRMPPLAFLNRPTWSPGRKVAMLAQPVYLVVAVALLIVKAVQLAVGA